MVGENIGGAGDLQQQIKTAIGVHGMWKSRIMQACQTGKSEWEPTFVAPNGNCVYANLTTQLTSAMMAWSSSQ
ncbi:hypothetical protein MNBD_NITROSPINAE01-1915 [hydrothermal vent metagenome]|uniref:Uncharacterized protein n=1 Tax=hydrothermal vent metagenome TaxID=652676 RepID=A0A3B1BQY4_9ZZZZ